MSQPTYVVHALRGSTGERIAELRPQSLKAGRVLNGAGKATLTLPITSANAADVRAATEPGLVELYVERGGAIVWGGRCWSRRYESGQQMLTVEAAELWSYMRRRKIAAQLIFAATDQLEIAEAIIDYAQDQPGGDLGLVVDYTASGVQRDRTYEAWELKPVGEAVEQLAAVQDGFDFAVDLAWSGEAVSKVLTFSYPRRGRPSTVSPLLYETKRDLGAFSLSDDAWGVANRVHGVGAGDGPEALTATADRTWMISQGWPLLESSYSWKDVSEPGTLQAHVRSELNATADVLVRPSLRLLPNIELGVGAYVIGDDVRVRFVDDPWASTLDSYYRIVGDELSVDSNGVESVSLTVANLTPDLVL